MTADIHVLTGAYALDAIPGPERAAFERHLAECESCAQEVHELLATAARLGGAAEEAPPPELKARVMAGIARTRQLPPPTGVVPLRPRRSRWTTRLLGLAAAVLLVVSVSLSVVVFQLREDLAETRQASAVAAVLGAEDARVVSGSTVSGLRGTVVVSRQRGQVVLLAGGIPAAPPGKAYQVWLFDGAGAHPGGLFRPDRSGLASHVDASDVVRAATAIGVTLEPEAGSAAPSMEPLMKMVLPA